MERKRIANLIVVPSLIWAEFSHFSSVFPTLSAWCHEAKDRGGPTVWIYSSSKSNHSMNDPSTG